MVSLHNYTPRVDSCNRGVLSINPGNSGYLSACPENRINQVMHEADSACHRSIQNKRRPLHEHRHHHDRTVPCPALGWVDLIPGFRSVSRWRLWQRCHGTGFPARGNDYQYMGDQWHTCFPDHQRRDSDIQSPDARQFMRCPPCHAPERTLTRTARQQHVIRPAAHGP